MLCSDVLIVGAGPAGIAAATVAAQAGVRVLLVDENTSGGGQVWRAEQKNPSTPVARKWFAEFHRARIECIYGARVFDCLASNLLRAETSQGIVDFKFDRMIIATGARERFLPFPGWTLPNVMGAGGLQALVKSGLSIRGKKIVVAGSGPLLLAAAKYLLQQGAQIQVIAEQTSWFDLFRFGWHLWAFPRKMFEALRLRWELGGVPYLPGCWVVSAHGAGKLQSVTLFYGGKTWQEECDYLACGFHLVPNVELAMLLGCRTELGSVHVDEFQETTVPRTYSAGETTGVGGVELSLVEGQIAGYASTGRMEEARALFQTRRKLRRFSQLLDRTFSLREELKNLPNADTIICRCEDVPLKRINPHGYWKAAKLQTRCGMGPCQGRICGSALEFLKGWKMESVRPPLYPVRLESLAAKPMEQGGAP